MNKTIILLAIGTTLITSCHKEDVEPYFNNEFLNDSSMNHPSKTINFLHIEKEPSKNSYTLNEPIQLEGISIKIGYTDGTDSTLNKLPMEWLKGFSSKTPGMQQKIRIQPDSTRNSPSVSFFVDILPIKVENNEIVEVIESDFKTITIPEGIKSIKAEAFGENGSLEKIILPSSLKTIGKYAFYGSQNLKTVDFSKTDLEELPSGTFESCYRLSEVNLPKNLKRIGGNSFYGTKSLQEIEIPEGVEEIGNTAFSHSGIVSIKLPHSIHTVKRSFYQCPQLKSVTTYGKKENVINQEGLLHGETFRHCPNLETLEIPEGIVKIATSVLGDCKVEKLIIPATVEHIEFNAFRNAKSLKQIILKKNEKRIIEKDAFPPCQIL